MSASVARPARPSGDHAQLPERAGGQSIAVESLRLARRIVLATQTMQKYAPEEFLPGPNFQTDEELVKAAGNVGTTIFHPVGSCKMGHADDQARWSIRSCACAHRGPARDRRLGDAGDYLRQYQFADADDCGTRRQCCFRPADRSELKLVTYGTSLYRLLIEPLIQSGKCKKMLIKSRILLAGAASL